MTQKRHECKTATIGHKNSIISKTSIIKHKNISHNTGNQHD